MLAEQPYSDDTSEISHEEQALAAARMAPFKRSSKWIKLIPDASMSSSVSSPEFATVEPITSKLATMPYVSSIAPPVFDKPLLSRTIVKDSSMGAAACYDSSLSKTAFFIRKENLPPPDHLCGLASSKTSYAGIATAKTAVDAAEESEREYDAYVAHPILPSRSCTNRLRDAIVKKSKAMRQGGGGKAKTSTFSATGVHLGWTGEVRGTKHTVPKPDASNDIRDRVVELPPKPDASNDVVLVEADIRDSAVELPSSTKLIDIIGRLAFSSTNGLRVLFDNVARFPASELDVYLDRRVVDIAPGCRRITIDHGGLLGGAGDEPAVTMPKMERYMRQVFEENLAKSEAFRPSYPPVGTPMAELDIAAVPVVDASELDSADTCEKALTDIKNSIDGAGCFYLTKHGITEDEILAVRSVGLNAWPEVRKVVQSVQASGSERDALDKNVRDLESFNIYYDKVSALSEKIAAAVLHAYGGDGSYLLRKLPSATDDGRRSGESFVDVMRAAQPFTKDSPVQPRLDFNFYEPQGTADTGDLFGAHKDSHLVTIISSDAGFQIWNKSEKRFQDIPLPDSKCYSGSDSGTVFNIPGDALFCFVGQAFDMMLQNESLALIHRVRRAAEFVERTRVSLQLTGKAHYDLILHPSRALCDEKSFDGQELNTEALQPASKAPVAIRDLGTFTYGVMREPFVMVMGETLFKATKAPEALMIWRGSFGLYDTNALTKFNTDVITKLSGEKDPRMKQAWLDLSDEQKESYGNVFLVYMDSDDFKHYLFLPRSFDGLLDCAPSC